MVLDPWHLDICLWGHPFVDVPFHHQFSMAAFTFKKLWNSLMWEMYVLSTSTICAPPCCTYFFHTKFVLLLGFANQWIAILKHDPCLVMNDG